MKQRFPYVAENRERRGENPGVQRRMRVTSHVHGIALENIASVIGMQRIDLRVLGSVEIIRIVTLDRLVEKGQAQQEDKRDDSESAAYHCTGTPGCSAHTSVSGRSRISSASCSGRPVSAGNVPKCSGITLRTFSIRHASAASRGLIV